MQELSSTILATETYSYLERFCKGEAIQEDGKASGVKAQF